MNSKQTIPGFKERLLKIIGEVSPYVWAEQVGIPKATMNGLLRYATPSTATLLKISQKTRVSISWLLTGDGVQNEGGGAGQFREGGVGVEHSTSTSTVLMAPRVSQSDPVRAWATWLSGQLNLDPAKVLMVPVTGDGMEPLLRVGDWMLVDQGIIDVQSDAIYLFERAGELLPRRVRRKLDGSLLVKGDNLAYDGEIISSEQSDELLMRGVIGRVVWIGHYLL